MKSKKSTSGLVGNTSGLVGNTSGLVGNTSGLVGNTSGLVGNTSGLVGNTSGSVGNTSGLVGNTSGLVGMCCFYVIFFGLPGLAEKMPPVHKHHFKKTLWMRVMLIGSFPKPSFSPQRKGVASSTNNRTKQKKMKSANGSPYERDCYYRGIHRIPKPPTQTNN